MTLVFDIETNGLLLDVDKFWVGVTYNVETKEEKVFYSAEGMANELNLADTIVGHNIIGYDVPTITKLTGIEITTHCIDTLILAKLAYYDKDRSWSHSLDAYGQRLGEAKGKYSDWSKYTPEMEDYCRQDVKVTYKLYQHLKRKTSKWLPDEALQLEQDVNRIITKQYIKGWKFDERKAKELHVELSCELDEAKAKLLQVFKPMFLPKGKVSEPKRQFRRMGVLTCGPHQPIVLTSFNAGSGKHIVRWVEHLYGKQDWKRTEKGSPKTDAETLMEMFSDKEWSKPLLHYLEVQKILGQLADGPKAWLKLVGKDGRIHGQMDTLGANSGRATHSNPNIGQVPSVRAYKGKEARSLFTVPKGKVLVAADLSGVELRCLAHYMARYDGGAYAKIILEGDIHTANMEAAGLTSRDQAKTMIYGYLFGAGDAKIGQIVEGGSKEGKKIRSTFEKKLPAIGALSEAVKKAAKKKWILGINGRRLHIRSQHSALNTLLQSLGAYVSKYWMVEVHKMLDAEGIIAHQLAWIHDELEFECEEGDADRIIEILEEAALRAGEVMGIRMPIHAEGQKGVSWDEVH